MEDNAQPTGQTPGDTGDSRGLRPAPHPADSAARSLAGIPLRPRSLPSRGLPGRAGVPAPGPGGRFLHVQLAPSGKMGHLPEEVGEHHSTERQHGQHSQHLQLKRASLRGPHGMGVPYFLVGREGLSSAEA